MTRTGEMRARYSAEFETAPSRFIDDEGTTYGAWAARADAWAAKQTTTTTGQES
jgi:hypothetical protein